MRVRSFSYLLGVSIALGIGMNCGEISAAQAGNGEQQAVFEDIDQIRQQVGAFLRTHYIDESNADANISADNVNIAVGRLDPRLRLKSCDNPLTFELQDNGNYGGNVAVRTRCEGSVLWSIFVQAQVTISMSITVAKHNLARGTVLQADDLETRMVNTSILREDYVLNPSRVIGKELSRPISKGNAVRLANLLEPKVIKRGDAVIVEAKSGLIYVSTPGTALTDGKLGQQIRVRNERSKQEINVEVVGPGRVRVIL